MGLFDAIGDAVSSIADAVTDVAEAVGLDDVADVIGLDDMFDAVSNLGVGGWLNDLSDSLGLPDWFGDVAGAVADAMTGNVVGAVANGLDAIEDVALACGEETLAKFLKAGSEITEMFLGDTDVFEMLGDPAELFDEAVDFLGQEIDDEATRKLIEEALNPVLTGGPAFNIATEFVLRP